MLSTLLIFALLLGSVILYFVKTSPEFGGKITDQLIEKYKKSENWKEDKFVNLQETSLDIPLSDYPSLISNYFKPSKNKRPAKNIETLAATEKPDSLDNKLTWFGHSAFWLAVGSKNILIDPMFGQVAAPHPKLGQKRYSTTLPIAVENLPEIDAIILSHDHYDHLDYGSIMALKAKVKHYYVPLGVGRHLEAWGISKTQITELDWWQESQLEDINLAFTPSRHFSGRGITDRAKTLWGSWVIKTPTQNLFFSGDGGYGPHFKEIGAKYGPFDFAMMECGQYNKLWSQIHCMPEETVQAALDLNTKITMPIHWGAFTLALHTWKDPIERISKEANLKGLPLCTPKIGEPITIGKTYPQEQWWVGLE